MSSQSILALAVFGIGLIIWILWVRKYSSDRAEAIRNFSQEYGFSFAEKGEKTFIDELKPMRLFSKGRSKKIRNHLSKEIKEAKLDVFDYTYSTGGGQSRRTQRQTVVLFRSPKLQYPPFSLRPKNILHSIGLQFGLKEIKIDSDSSFSEQFLLRSDQEDQIQLIFTIEKLAMFEANSGISCDGKEGYLVVFRNRKRPDPEELNEFIDRGTEIFNMFAR